jgi:hypothetical protein
MPHKVVATVFHREELRMWDGSRGWVSAGFATCDVKIAINEEALAKMFAQRALKSPRRRATAYGGALVVEVSNLRKTAPPAPVKGESDV